MLREQLIFLLSFNKDVEVWNKYGREMSEGKGIVVNGNMSSDSACDILIVWFLWEQFF